MEPIQQTYEIPGPDGWRPKAITFDAFGTLVEIGVKRRPYHRFTQRAHSIQGMPDPLVTDLPMADWARMAGAAADDVAAAEVDLAVEVASVRLRDWAAPAWAQARLAGIGIAVCSNLATPYGPPLLACLPGTPDLTILSYEVGLRKPDPAIYALVAAKLELAPSDILFVGDTPAADYDGPLAAGMRAMPIEMFERIWPKIIGLAPT